MELWVKSCLLLCSYGFFKELRPSEPFLTEYLLGPHHNLTETEVYFDVYPVWTYSYLSLLVVVFLFTDLLRYKPVIVFEGIGYVATWSLLLWGGGVRWMQLMEFCYGIATSTEVAYYTYIYAQVDGKYYQKVTSYTRCALLAGRFSSSLLSQVLYSTGLLDYHSLNYFSLSSVVIALCITFFLPSPKNSIYFHREQPTEIPLEKSTDQTTAQTSQNSNYSTAHDNKVLGKGNVKKVMHLLWEDFTEAYSNRYLLKWSIWWAFATCMNFQVGGYIQPLWESIAPFQESEAIYNGAVEGISTLIGALAALAVGYVNLNWVLMGEMTLAVISLLDALLLLFMGLTSDIWIAYINYIAFRVSYQVLMTVASFQVAKELKADSYGLVFGVNMFMALVIQTVLTVVVAEWLETELGLQFVIYGCYLATLSLLFFTFSFFSLRKLGIEEIRRMGLWVRPNEGENFST